MADIFKFWSVMERGQKIHPADRAVFDLMNPKRHGFKLQCLPACFFGPLRTAPVVLLYLSPGYVGVEGDDAKSEEGMDYHYRTWKGREPLRNSQKISDWFKSRTRPFCDDFDVARRKIAILNIGAYHSKKMYSYASMLALPSSRLTLDWAQSVLFRKAIRKERIVICMRAAPHWGLEAGKKYTGTLFAPETTIGGFLRKTDRNKRIINLARQRIC